MRTILLIMALALSAMPALASSPGAWAAEDEAARTLCQNGSGLKDASATAPVHFSDRSGKSVLLVSGRYPQASMKGAAATMLCLYDRRSKTIELADGAAWTRPVWKKK